MDNRMNFFQLIRKYNIKVPIIQRDYAQGRENEKARHVRKNLIAALKSALEQNKNLDLNFVYGTQMSMEGSATFLPVDGQQRLTTLYLFYFYFFVVHGRIDRFMQECKSFSYATRTSAADFFLWLSSGSTKLIEVLKDESVVDLKKRIYCMSEFQAAWTNDPTVKSAIIMLDAIKRNVKKSFVDAYFERLISDECPIIFSVIIEENTENAEMNADKTYIRMNARGKILEDFENLRSMIDSIDKQIKPTIDIIGHYDRDFLNNLYDTCNGRGGLKEITEEINRKSYAAFMNIYNIVAFCFGERTSNELKAYEKEVAYRNAIYEYSKTMLTKEEKLCSQLAVYIEMLDSYFTYCHSLKEFTYDNCIFTKGSIKQELSCEGRYTVAEVLYCYFYKKKQNKTVSREQMADFKYVLKNLKLEKWSNFWGVKGNLRVFCGAVAEYEDVFMYFQNMNEEAVKSSIGVDNSVLDLRVRFKEQIIKTKIIKSLCNGASDKEIITEDIKYRYFERYENACAERKLQFFLYIAGCWDVNLSQWKDNTFAILESYLKKAQTWFLGTCPGELDFRKLYAIAANMDENNKLLPSNEINQVCGENRHIWDRNVCFWSDEEEYGERYDEWKTKCMLAKRTYCMEEHHFNAAKDSLETDAYNNCWLKYAVKYDYEKLLSQRLKVEGEDIFIEVMYDGWRNYPLYIYKLRWEEQKKKNGINRASIKWGNERLIMSFFTWQNDTGEISDNRPERIPYGRNVLPCTGNVVEVKETFNANLYWSVKVKIDDKSPCSENEYLFFLENDQNEQWYKRVVYQKGEPFRLLLEEFDISQAVKEVYACYESEKDRVQKFTMDAFLELYEESLFGHVISRSVTSSYKRKSSRSRTWEYVQTVRRGGEKKKSEVFL